MGRSAAAMLLALALGCGGSKVAPPPPGSDGGADSATGGGDAGGPPPPPGRSDAGLVLPTADQTVQLPFGGPSATVLLQVPASPRRLDVHLSVDTTESFGQEIDAMQAGLEQLIDTLTAQVSEVSVGVSRFEDFPVAPFGEPTDEPFELLTPITSDRSAVTRAVDDLDQPLGLGGDLPEAGAEALYQIATGAGRAAPYPIPAWNHRAAVGGGTLGGVGFRSDALRVVVHVTDAPAHYPQDYGTVVPGTHSLDDAAQALVALDAKLIGIASRSPDAFDFARSQLEQMAIATGAVVPPSSGSCPTGIDGSANPPVGGVCPLVFDIAPDGTGLSRALSGGILSLLATVRYAEVYPAVTDDRFGFVQAVEASAAVPPAGAAAPTLADAHPPGDGIADTFVQVAAGTQLTFAVHLRNDVLPDADYDQVFRVTVTIYGDAQLLATQVVRVVVPAVSPTDGGLSDGSTA